MFFIMSITSFGLTIKYKVAQRSSTFCIILLVNALDDYDMALYNEFTVDAMKKEELL